MTDKPRGQMTVQEAGQRGGAKRSEALGPEGYRELGKKGGSATRDKHGAAHYAAAGHIGGSTVRERHGSEFFQRIGKLGGSKLKALVAQGKAAEEGDEGAETDEQSVHASTGTDGQGR